MKTVSRHRTAGSVLASLLALSLAGLPGNVALARDFNSSVQKQVVDYSDLNLASERGVATLHARLRAAAQALCGPPEPLYLRIRQLQRNCIGQAVTEAVREIDHPGLNAYHARTRLAKFARARAATPALPEIASAD